MVSPEVVHIESVYFVVYLSCVYIHVRLVMSSYLFLCIYSNACISHAVQNEVLEIYIG